GSDSNTVGLCDDGTKSAIQCSNVPNPHVFFPSFLSPPISTLFPYTTLFRSAVFNVVSTLVMVVNDKRSEIAILRTLGLAPKSIRSEEHTSELQSRFELVCRLLLEKKKCHSRL